MLNKLSIVASLSRVEIIAEELPLQTTMSSAIYCRGVFGLISRGEFFKIKKINQINTKVCDFVL